MSVSRLVTLCIKNLSQPYRTIIIVKTNNRIEIKFKIHNLLVFYFYSS